MEPKICPIMTIGNHQLGISCKGESCAWYIANNKRCAVAYLAECADVVAYHLDEIASGDLFAQQ